jgi:membrane protein DedA with SNARE-associated domain/rhodanese-related sulfurtransferase
MQEIAHLIALYGLFAVFVNVLLDEGGLPLPSYPLLAVAGALTATTSLSLGAVLAAALLASAIADNSWYWVSRRYGRRVLSLLCKVSLSPDSCVRQTESLFTRIGPVSLLFSKFVPGLGNITVALAGITRLPLYIFMPLQVAGATLFLGLPILLGRLFYNAVDDILQTLARMGEYGLGIIVLALISYLGLRWYERAAFIRQLRMDRITVEELAALLADGTARPLLLDVRSAESRLRDGIIPGALAAHPQDMHPILKDHARDAEIVIYCACPNEATAALAARHLRRAGFRKIRPLLGGIDAWAQSGRDLHFTS